MLKLVVIQIVVTTLTNMFFSNLLSCVAYLIFVANATNMFVEKKSAMWKISPHFNVETFSCDKLSWGKSSPHEKCETTL